MGAQTSRNNRSRSARSSDCWRGVGTACRSVCVCCNPKSSKNGVMGTQRGKSPTAFPMMEVKTARDLDLSAKVFIVTHGGCPDGQASAYILRGAVLALKPGADVQVLQGAHAGRVSPVDIDFADSVVVFTDICPVEADSQVIEVARQVVVLDHHPTTETAMAPLKAKFGGKINDLSINDGKSCGASLAQAFCEGVFAMDPDALEFHWKMDVFQHQLPKHLEPPFNAFKGWINQKGTRDCDVSLVEQFAKDKEGCLKKGEELYEPVLVNSRRAAAAHKLAYGESGFKLYVVDMDAAKATGEITSDPIDLIVYQEEIDKLKEMGVAVAFMTIDRKVNPQSKAWNLGLRRAGELVDMGKVATALKTNAGAEGFVSGGGHAFAAGAQCTDSDIKMDALVRIVVTACKQSLTRRVILPIPGGAAAGANLQWTAPDGQQLHLTVPKEASSGSKMALTQDPNTLSWNCVVIPAAEPAPALLPPLQEDHSRPPSKEELRQPLMLVGQRVRVDGLGDGVVNKFVKNYTLWRHSVHEIEFSSEDVQNVVLHRKKCFKWIGMPYRLLNDLDAASTPSVHSA